MRCYARAEARGVPEEILSAIETFYSDLRSTAGVGFVTPQLEQNDFNVSPEHYTLLGSLDRRARVIADALC